MEIGLTYGNVMLCLSRPLRPMISQRDAERPHTRMSCGCDPAQRRGTARFDFRERWDEVCGAGKGCPNADRALGPWETGSSAESIRSSSRAAVSPNRAAASSAFPCRHSRRIPDSRQQPERGPGAWRRVRRGSFASEVKKRVYLLIVRVRSPLCLQHGDLGLELLDLPAQSLDRGQSHA